MIGWDLGAAMALAQALGVNPLVAAEILPAIEAVAVRAINEQLRSGSAWLNGEPRCGWRWSAAAKCGRSSMAIGADGQRSLEGIGRGAQSAGAGLRLLDGNAAAARQQIAHLRGQTGNLAAQFQDIGVQLAGGQSPFLIALQQGGQISQVLGPAGARGAVAALAGAFAALVSPVSLATIGIIAAGGAAIQYFSTLGDGEKSAEELQKQADRIGQVGKAVGATRSRPCRHTWPSSSVQRRPKV